MNGGLSARGLARGYERGRRRIRQLVAEQAARRVAEQNARVGRATQQTETEAQDKPILTGETPVPPTGTHET